MNETTPADLVELAARADQLAADIDAARAALAQGPAFRLPDAAGEVRRVAADLRETAEDQARVRARPADACPADWGVCPVHGNTLTSSGGRSWCRADDCDRTWNYDRGGEPCAEPVRWLVTDETGYSFRACDGHATAARAQIIGATVEPVTGTSR